MKIVSWIFLAFMFYGILIEHYGGASFSLLLALLMLYADRKFKEQERKHAAMPRESTKKPLQSDKKDP